MPVLRSKWFIVPALLLVILPLIGWSLDWPIVREFRENKCRKGLDYVNVDFVCERPPVIAKTSYLTTRNDILAYAEKEFAEGRLAEVSLYFRDLHNGPVLGINEMSDFAPASLMKLPLVFAFFHIEEENPGFLQQKTTYKKEHVGDIPDLVQTVVSGAQLVVGQEYTIEQLLKDTLIYSDNDAYYTLVEYANAMQGGPMQVLTAFQELGIIDPRAPEEEVVSVRGYASLYRLLYNASYLNVENSEKVLEWLAASVYDKGLEAGVPDEVPVAHKFGEREYPDGTKQLHDCGIVFFPKNPYSLCIMTKGNDYEKLTAIIAEISRIIYEEVNSRRL